MGSRGTLRLATCQFTVGADIRRNGRMIRRQMATAAADGAQAVHFSEAALSGYAGFNFAAWDGFDWDLLKDETGQIMDLARRKKIWVILGSAHRLTGRHLPHNCLYAIDSRGRLAERYDKHFCTGGDLKFYTPGTHFPVVTINGIRCGMLICYDVRFPELYRQYSRRGVRLMFHSFHNAGMADGPTIHTEIMRPSLQTHAATNYMWVSGNNSSRSYQAWASLLIQPNGHIAASAPRHRAAVIVNTVDMCTKYYDAAGANRDLAIQGRLNNGRAVSDPRSRQRHSL